MDRQNGDLIRLTFFFKESRINSKFLSVSKHHIMEIYGKVEVKVHPI
jgi:hypothetical protein